MKYIKEITVILLIITVIILLILLTNSEKEKKTCPEPIPCPKCQVCKEVQEE